MIPKREAELKSALKQAFKRYLPSFVIQSHEDVRTAAHPDWSITGCGWSSWWEFKHGTPRFEGTGLQELQCLRLATAGFCRYVIWQETAAGHDQRTLIVHPVEVHERVGWTLKAEAATRGFDHRWLVEQIRLVHNRVVFS